MGKSGVGGMGEINRGWRKGVRENRGWNVK